MFNLQSRIKGNDEDRQYLETRIAVRDRLVAQEMKDLETTMRGQNRWKLQVPDSSILHDMVLTVTPQEGLYKGGVFRFKITVPPEYNNVPPVVKCLTKLWHPNITEDGAICLSILRQNSLDHYGWKPTRNLREVVQGLADLFGDLMDFGDPLNIQAAKMWGQSQESFKYQVNDYIRRYC